MLKPFQKQDLARAAMHDGLILAWDTGLGKTWAAFLWPLLKLGYDWDPPLCEEPAGPTNQLLPRGSVLLIAPGDLHQQIREEAQRRFHIPLKPLGSQEAFLGLVTRIDPDGRPVLPFGFYITSYHALAINGSRPSPTAPATGGPAPSLAELCWNAFDCVVVDEGVRMKGEDTLTGMRVRQLAPRYRLVLTGTPVKNRLPDLFRLAWWAAGGKSEAHARWPYRDDSAERRQFANTFLVSQRNLTRESASERAGKRRSSTKLTAQVCNVHRLWKLLAPVVLRRRKQDIGAELVPKLRHVIRVPMGTEQAAVYAYHLHAPYMDSKSLPAVMAKLQALRVAAAAPNSSLLTARGVCGKFRSSTGYTPKIHVALKLIEQFLRAGEQFVVFAAFHDPLDGLSQRLRRAGVRHAVLDGRTTPAKRGAIAARFKQGTPAHGHGGTLPGLLAGVECMAEGHDFYLANNVILLAYSWAFDKFEQAINRVHRLTSPKPVNVWSILCDGTIDRNLEASIQEKADSARFILDGQLLGERTEEFSLAQLLSEAEPEFNRHTETVAEIEVEWPVLEETLRQAQAQWDQLPQHPYA